MLVPFHHAFEGEGSGPTFYETTFRNLRACTDVKVVFYALFYVFLAHFRNGMSSYTCHSRIFFSSRGRTYAWSGSRLVQTFCYKYHTSVGCGHVDGAHSASG